MAQASTPPHSPLPTEVASDIRPKSRLFSEVSSYAHLTSPRTSMAQGLTLPQSFMTHNQYISTINHYPDTSEILWLASKCIGSNAIAMIPPFRNEQPETWRAVALEGIPKYTKVTELLQVIQPQALESVRQTVDCYGRYRVELRFLHHTAALLFYAQFILSPPIIDGPELPSINWVPAPAISDDLWEMVDENKASRFLLIDYEDDGKSQDSIRIQLFESLAGFGIIQSLKCCSSITDKGLSIWEVTFTCLEAAIRAQQHLQLEKVVSVQFGRDVPLSRLQKHAASLFLTKSPYNPTNLRGLRSFELMNALANQSLAAIIVAQLSGGELNVGNRCVCVSRLPPGTQLVEICNTVRGGMLECVKLVPERNMCFVTFLEPTAAAQFWATYQMRPLNVNCERVRVGWGRNPGPVAPEIAAIVGKGATRNLCIQIDPQLVKYSPPVEDMAKYDHSKGSTGATELPLALNERELHKMFSPFGTIEQVRVARDVCCSFVTFTGIVNAVQAVNWARDSQNFTGAQIQYGKDRCAALPRCVSRTNNTEPILIQFLRRKLPTMVAQAQAQAISNFPVSYPMVASPISAAYGFKGATQSSVVSTSLIPSPLVSSLVTPPVILSAPPPPFHYANDGCIPLPSSTFGETTLFPDSGSAEKQEGAK